METFLKDRQGFCCIGNVYFRYNLAFKGAPLVITFSFLGANATKEEAQKGSFVPWAYNFIVSQELNAISFCCIGKDNWYTDSEFQDKAAQLGEEIKATGLEVLGYGGSMGGFGVSALANPLGINRMLLFNPISSLHSKKADFEYRFKSARTSLDWDCLYNDGADANATGYIIYDPFFRVDALHANRYQNLTKLKFPGVGHSTPTHLSKINALKWVFSSFLNGEISRLDFGNKIRRKRKYKHYYSWMLSEKNNHLTPKRKEIIEKYYDVYRLTEGKAIIPRKEDVDYLRDMAVKYEDFDLRMSFDIMNMAARIRPEGLYIKKKLEEYGLKLKV